MPRIEYRTQNNDPNWNPLCVEWTDLSDFSDPVTTTIIVTDADALNISTAAVSPPLKPAA